MPFRPLARRAVRWRPVAGEGLEHLDLTAAADGIIAAAVVAGTGEAGPFALSYRIACDAAWRVRSLDVAFTSGARLSLRADGEGAWRETDGFARPDLAGAIDVDIEATPFTNTLPIRRLGASLSGETAIAVVYVALSGPSPRLERQLYDAIEPGRRYRFATGDRSVSAELPVDADGLVLDYPELFLRL